MNKRKLNKINNIVLKIYREQKSYGILSNAITIKETDYLHKHLKKQDWVLELYRDYIDNGTDTETEPSNIDEYLDYFGYMIVAKFVELGMEDEKDE